MFIFWRNWLSFSSSNFPCRTSIAELRRSSPSEGLIVKFERADSADFEEGKARFAVRKRANSHCNDYFSEQLQKRHRTIECKSQNYSNNKIHIKLVFLYPKCPVDLSVHIALYAESLALNLFVDMGFLLTLPALAVLASYLQRVECAEATSVQGALASTSIASTASAAAVTPAPPTNFPLIGSIPQRYEPKDLDRLWDIVCARRSF